MAPNAPDLTNRRINLRSCAFRVDRSIKTANTAKRMETLEFSQFLIGQRLVLPKIL